MGLLRFTISTLFRWPAAFRLLPKRISAEFAKAQRLPAGASPHLKKEGSHEWARMHTNGDKLFVPIRAYSWQSPPSILQIVMRGFRSSSIQLHFRRWLSGRPLGLELFGAVVVSISCTGIYEICNWVTARRRDVGTLYFGWERHIPFVPAMIVPYVSMDPLFFLGFFLCTSRREVYVLARRLVWAAVLAGICFLLYPLKMVLHRPPDTGVFALLFRFQDIVDRPYNLVPSLHIAQCVIVGAVYGRHCRGWMRMFVVTWFVLIGLSTVLTYQHQVVDVVAGLGLAWICVRAFPACQARASL